MMLALVLSLALAQQAAQKQTPALATPLDRAEDAIEQGDYERARPEIESYIAAHPADARARYDLGFVQLQTNQTAQAEASLREAVRLDAKLPQPHIALGRALALEKRNDDALAEWHIVTDDAAAPPGLRAEAYRNIAELQLAAKDTSAASEALVSALRISPETPEDQVLTARIADAAGDPATAEAEFRKAAAASPDDAAVAVALATELRREKKYTDAEQTLRTAARTHPDDGEVSAALAETLALEGKNDEALTLLNAAHDKHPENDALTKMLADVANQRGADPALAARLFSDMLAKHPDDPALLADYGASLVRQLKYAEAVPVLKHALVANPANADAWGALAFAAAHTENFPLVIQSLTERKKYSPDNVSTYFLWGQAYDRLHQVKEAADNYRRFLALAGGKFPDQEFQARHRLIAMGQDKK